MEAIITTDAREYFTLVLFNSEKNHPSLNDVELSLCERETTQIRSIFLIWYKKENEG